MPAGGGAASAGATSSTGATSYIRRVSWYRLWLWVLLWGVLTYGVEPSQRAVKPGEPSHMEPQSQSERHNHDTKTTSPDSASQNNINPNLNSCTRAEGTFKEGDTVVATTTTATTSTTTGCVETNPGLCPSHHHEDNSSNNINGGKGGRQSGRSSTERNSDAPAARSTWEEAPEGGDPPSPRPPSENSRDEDNSSSHSNTEILLDTASPPPQETGITSPKDGGPWLSKKRHHDGDRGRDGDGADGDISALRNSGSSDGEGGRTGGARRGADVLKLEPSMLAFDDSALCIPTSAVVVVKNTKRPPCTGRRLCPPSKFLRWRSADDLLAPSPSPSRDWLAGVVESMDGGGDGGDGEEGWVQLLSVTSDNPQFHPSSFQPQALPPEGETSFQVVFLPRAVGAVDAVLTIATSEGDVTYNVQAQGVQNPYKLQPIIASRIPAGSTFTRPIIVYNPRDSPSLTITEIFTTEGFLHLAMPDELARGSGAANSEGSRGKGGRSSRGNKAYATAFRDSGMEAPPKPPGLFVEGGGGHGGSAWHIPPGVEVEVIRVSFTAGSPGNFHGHVHIRTDRESMVVPVDFHVSRGGVDPNPSNIDFGVLTSPSERRQASVSLFNSGSEPMLIVGARVSTPDPRINVGFREGTVIGAGEEMEDAVRLIYSGGEPISYEGEGATAPATNGTVLIAVNHTVPELDEVEIGYRAHILHGGVAYEWGQVSFQVGVGGNFLPHSGATAPHYSSSGTEEPPSPLSPSSDNKGASSSSSPSLRGRSSSREGRFSSGVGGVLSDGGGMGAMLLPASETRALDLKNHFPVAMKLLSLEMEDCQDILSVAGFEQMTAAASVALPQESWKGVSLSFQRSVAAGSGTTADNKSSDESNNSNSNSNNNNSSNNNGRSPSSSPPSLEPKLLPPASTEMEGSYFGEQGMGRDGRHNYPSTDQEGAHRGQGTYEDIPSVSADQRTLAQKALDDYHDYNSAGRGEIENENDRQQHQFEDGDTSYLLGGQKGGRRDKYPRSPPFTCTLRAETNASTHHIPVFVFDGTLHFSVLEEDKNNKRNNRGRGAGRGAFGWSVASGKDDRDRDGNPERHFSSSEQEGWPREPKTPSSVGGMAVFLPPDSRFPYATEPGTKEDPSPSQTRPLVVHLGTVRAGGTARRQFNVTNLNPVEVNVTSIGGGGALPFASLRVVGIGPLAGAPQALLEIGRHIENRSHNKEGATDSSPLFPARTSGAARLSSPTTPQPAMASSSSSEPSPPSWAPQSSSTHELVRETVMNGGVSNRETLKIHVAGAGGVEKSAAKGSKGKSWVSRRGGAGKVAAPSSGAIADEKEEVVVAADEHVVTLVPGATAMFEVAATAPEDMVEGSVKMEVQGLLLSTPVETVPILVTYDAVSGGIFFHAPPLENSAGSPLREEETETASLQSQQFDTEKNNQHAAELDTGETENAAELDEGEIEVAVHLENAFPGRVAASGVSLRSTASWEGRVEGMESSGPLVQATLARRDVPGVSRKGGVKRKGSANTDDDGVVEVGRVEYNASQDCFGVDAWVCVAKRAEVEWDGSGDNWRITEGFESLEGQSGRKEAGEDLGQTLLRLVGHLHDDQRTNGIPTQASIASGNTIAGLGGGNAGNGGGGGGGSPGTVVYRCAEGSTLNVDAGVDPRRMGCSKPRRLRNTNGIGSGDIFQGERAASAVGDKAARAAKELWKLWPKVVESGLNRFREEIAVRTTLGPAATPLSVHVSLAVPRLVVGVANYSAADPSSSSTEKNDGGDVIPSPPGNEARDGPAIVGGYKPVRFPLTQVREACEIFIEIRNPADVPVTVQLAAAEGESVVWTEPPTRAGQPLVASVAVGVDVAELGASAAASLSATTTSSSDEQQQRQQSQQQQQQQLLGFVRDGGTPDTGAALAAFHVRIGGFAPVVLAPGGSAVIGPVRFSPAREGVFSAHVYLRNNLTHLEPILLEGEAGSGILAVHPRVESGTGGVVGRVSQVFSAQEGIDGRGEEENDEVTRFAVDFRSWARSPHVMGPVVKRWVLSNKGTMPLMIHSVGLRKAGRSGWWWFWGNSSSKKSQEGSGRDDGDGAVGRWLWWLFFGTASKRGASSLSSSPFRGWREATAAMATSTAWKNAGTDITTSALLCSGGGFQMGGEACQQGRWRPQTLQPGQEIVVAVEYSAAHCDPVERILDVVSSVGSTSIRMLASAAGGPSAVAACRSAKRAAAASKRKASSSSKKRTDSGHGGVQHNESGGWHGRGPDGRWTRAWLLIKMAILVGALYAGCAVLGVGPELPLPPLASWVRQLQGHAAECFNAAYHRCGSFAVSVEVRASAAVEVRTSSSAAIMSTAGSGSGTGSGAPLSSSLSSFDSSSSLSSCHAVSEGVGQPSVGSAACRSPARSQAESSKINPSTSTSASSLPPPHRLLPQGNTDTNNEQNKTAVKNKQQQKLSTAVGGSPAAVVAAAASVIGKNDQPSSPTSGSDTKSATRVSPGGDNAAGVAAKESGAKKNTQEIAVVTVSRSGKTSIHGRGGGDTDDQDLAVTKAVEILTSPGQASRPSRQPAASPRTPGGEKNRGGGSGGVEERPLRPPAGTVNRQAGQRRTITSQGTMNTNATGKGGQKTQSPFTPVKTATPTMRQNQPIVDSAAKRGKIGVSATGTAGSESRGSGGLSSSPSSLQHGKITGRVSSSGTNIAGGGFSQHGGMASNHRAKGPAGSQPHHPAPPGRGGFQQPPSQGSVRPLPAASGKNLSHERASLFTGNNSSSSATAGSPRAPSAGSMITAREKNGRHQQQQSSDRGSGGHPPLGRGVQGGGYGRGGHYRRQGTGSAGMTLTATSPTKVPSPSVMAPPSWSGSSSGAQPKRQQPLYPAASGPKVHANGGLGVGTVAHTSSAAVKPFQRPQPSGWITEKSPQGIPAAARTGPVSPSGGGGGGSVNASPRLEPIGSNRLRAKSAAAAVSTVGPIGGMARRPPPGLATPPGLPPPIMNSCRPLTAAAGGAGARRAVPMGSSGLSPSVRGASASSTAALMEAEWSENLDTFATASAVAAASLDDGMDDPGGGAPPSGDLGLETAAVGRNSELWERSYLPNVSEVEEVRQARSFSTPAGGSFGQQAARKQQAAPPSAISTSYRQGLAFDAKPFVPGISSFEIAPGFTPGRGGGGGRGVTNPSAFQLSPRARANGGSRLGYYMSSASSVGGGADGRDRSARGNAPEVFPSTSFGLQDDAAQLFFGGSSLSYLGSSPSSGPNVNDMFGFIEDDDHK